MWNDTEPTHEEFKKSRWSIFQRNPETLRRIIRRKSFKFQLYHLKEVTWLSKETQYFFYKGGRGFSSFISPYHESMRHYLRFHYSNLLPSLCINFECHFEITLCSCNSHLVYRFFRKDFFFTYTEKLPRIFAPPNIYVNVKAPLRKLYLPPLWRSRSPYSILNSCVATELLRSLMVPPAWMGQVHPFISRRIVLEKCLHYLIPHCPRQQNWVAFITLCYTYVHVN